MKPKSCIVSFYHGFTRSKQSISITQLKGAQSETAVQNYLQDKTKERVSIISIEWV